MSEPQTDEQAGQDDGYPDEVVQYRSPSILAILTLLLGVLSSLALLKPMLWVFPVVTLCVGIASLYALAKNPLRIGRKAILIGLALALFFLAWGSSHYFLRRQWLAHHARQYADAWLELIRQDRLRDAHQLHLRKLSRIAEGVSIEDYYAKHPYAQPDFESFYDKPPLKTLVKLGPSANVVFERVESYEVLPNSDTLILDYRAEYVDRGRSKVLPVRIVMVRDRDSTVGEFNWCVDSVKPPESTTR